MLNRMLRVLSSSDALQALGLISVASREFYDERIYSVPEELTLGLFAQNSFCFNLVELSLISASLTLTLLCPQRQAAHLSLGVPA